MKNVVVITGGAGGMGLATAVMLGGEGYSIVIADIDQTKLDAALEQLRSRSVDVTAVQCDITDPASVGALMQAARSIGRIKSVIHTAGVSPSMGAPDRIISINAAGTVHITEACLADAGEGFSLILVSSIAGHMLPSLLRPTRIYRLALTDKPHFVSKLTSRANFNPKRMRSGQAYSLSKNFVLWYTAKMATRFGEKGARIVSVSPGSFDTSMGRLEEKSGAGKLTEIAALKRFGRPEEVAELLAFLGSGKAFYITGTDILIDGGAKANMTLKAMLDMAKGDA